ncbi:MAG: hypothetical protein ACREA4_06525 [Nitrososphaera sp.]
MDTRISLQGSCFYNASNDNLPLAGRLFYAAIAAGAAFIAIGIASSVYSSVPVDVPLDYTLRPGMVDVISPDMNAGNTLAITVSGPGYDVAVVDPDGQLITSERGNSTFVYELTAGKPGEYRITVNNTGTGDVTIDGHAQTKSSPLGLTGALMLAVTGIIVIGLGLRFRKP